MSTKHTPGPWVVGYGDAVGIGEVFGVGLETEPDWTPVCILSLSEKVNETDEANALLIAQSTELLELAEQLVLGMPIGDLNRDMDSLWDIARWIDEKHGVDNFASRKLKALHRKAARILDKATGGAK